MEQRTCIFCQIARNKIPAKIVYEDENSLAFLDVAPRSKGMCIVIPRQHYKEFDENIELSEKIFSSALKVAERIKKTLNPKSVSISVISSEEIPHFHVRVYPVYEDQIPLIENKPLQVTEDELDSIAQKIRAEEPKKEEEKKEEKKEEEKPRTKEEIYWMKRQMEI